MFKGIDWKTVAAAVVVIVLLYKIGYGPQQLASRIG